MKALILVDIQNDFMPGGALAVKEADKIIPTINKLMPHFDMVVSTQDWHPKNHGSFAANQIDQEIGSVIELAGLPQILWPVHCVQHTQGANFVATLAVSKVAKVFPKGTDPMIDSYSGFFDNGHRKATGMGDYLKKEGVKEVYLVGVATDYCVKFTALDAVSLGFETYLIEDACKGVNLHPDDVTKALVEMKEKGVKIIQSNHFLKV